MNIRPERCSRVFLRWLAPILLLGLAACGPLGLAQEAVIPNSGTAATPRSGAGLTPLVPAEANPVGTGDTGGQPGVQTQESIPTSPPTPALTQAPTDTPAPTPTLHPMHIQALQQTAYPGSPVTIEQTLEPGANYSRYYASYLSEGYKIYALLTIPYGDPPPGGWPAIVFNHGYIPPDVYRTTERYIAYVDSLASHGYIVFRIDYRGHDRSEGEARGAYGDPGYTVDVLNAVSTITQLPEANPERIGMWGHSMGGYLTLRAMVISPQVKVGVIWAGVVASYPDLLTRWRRDSGSLPTPNPRGGRRWRTEWIEQFGSPEENPDFWNGISANSYLAEISGPVQLHHGTADESVPLEFSEMLYQQLLEAGKTVEYYTYEGDDHNISNLFSQAMTRTIEFFDRFLK